MLVLGEVLVELSSPEPLRSARSFELSFSGDALNAAAASAAAGASVGLLACVGDDDLGDALIDRVRELGIEISLLRRVLAQNGIYFVSLDVHGDRQFVYARRGSAGSTLAPADVDAARVGRSAALVASGVTHALSTSCAAAVERAAQLVHDAGGIVVYDPNFRPRLLQAPAAREALARLAPLATLVTPSCPGDTLPLLGTDDAAAAARSCLELGAAAAAVTCGADGLVYADRRGGELALPGLRPPSLVDATGAGDVFTGTVAARLALGDDIEEALELGLAASSLSLGGRGGAGAVPTLAETRHHRGPR
ncbi:MAG: sugar kinase [Thermoleophilaceae bacterium]|nr:sugar kinase [Thermoleophilaceae bacterium]